MKTKQLAILLAIAAGLGGTVWVLQKGGQDSWQASPVRSGGKVLDFSLNDVTTVVLQNASGTTTVSRKGDNWVVEDRADYPANFERVSSLLRTLWDLKVVQDVKVGASQLSRFDLQEPGAGTRVDFKDKDGKPLASILLGKRFMKKSEAAFGDMGDFPAGRYVMPVGSGRVSLVSETFEDAEPKPESWINRNFIRVESPSSIVLKGATPAQQWKISRESASGDWKLDGAKDAEKLDQGKASPLSGALSSPSFVDVLAPDAKPADTGLDQPSVLTLETFDGFSYTLKLGKSTADNQNVTVEVAATFKKERSAGADEKPEDKTRLDDEFKEKLKRLEEKLAAEKKLEGRVFQVSKFVLEPFLKERSGFFAEAKPEAKAEATTPPVEVPKSAPKPAPKPASDATGKPVSQKAAPAEAPAKAAKPAADSAGKPAAPKAAAGEAAKPAKPAAETQAKPAPAAPAKP